MKVALIVVIVLFGAFLIWSEVERQDNKECRQKYGSEYRIGHSDANSSIKWCQSKDGTMKAI